MNNSQGKHVPDITITESISKSKPRIRGRKRKRLYSESSSDVDHDLPDNTLETEKNLHALAIKNNLDDISVKKILKKVVTNDHVLAFVKLREEEDSGAEDGLQPKFTRAKAKELMKVSPRVPPWPIQLTPIKHIPVKTRPEVTALIAQELPDDEDDEEYEPTHDDSDDDHCMESCSDLDSQPRTPATPLSQKKESPAIVKDGPFKVPQDVSITVRKKLELEEEATIALRTRSKLSLSETPIEHIESSFIPPDDLPMPDVDDLWNDFLSECLNPESKTNEEDDELDPEYNVAADPDANDEDEDALEKSIIKISKKELNDLVTELMNVMPEGVENQLLSSTQSDQSQSNNGAVDTRSAKLQRKSEVPHWEGKQEPLSDDETQPANIASKITFESSNIVSRVSVGKIEAENERDKDKQGSTLDSTKVPKTETPSTASLDITTNAASGMVTITVEEREHPVAEPEQSSIKPPASLLQLLAPQPLKVNIEVGNIVEMSPDQVSILQQQLRMHVQLAASNFLQLFVHPVHWSYAHKYKGYLETFEKILSSKPKSVVNVCNLTSAIELIRSWESSVSKDNEENKKMVEFIQEEVEKCRRRNAGNSLYVGDFPELFKKVVANSTVFLYPYMLPPLPFRSFNTHRRYNYLTSEDSLIVLGLEQFWWYVENNPDIFKPPQKLHPRRRWGLMITVRLICKHMMPWLSPKGLLSHIQSARKTEDIRNPIVKYFVEKTIDPVRHTILPYNPKMTLYEHPEMEMPRLWIKYLAANSKRFRHCSSRRYHTVKAPQGVEVQAGIAIEPIQKEALPIDFIKPISCNRINLIPKTPKPNFIDKVDVHIATTADSVADSNFLVASNLYTLVNTSSGAQLMPLRLQTSTVNSSTQPICSPAVIESDKTKENNKKIAEISIKQNCIVITPNNNSKDSDKTLHCPCCLILKRICKIRQSYITDYFIPYREKKVRECECTSKKYPRMTNKLKLLVNNFKTLSNVLYSNLLEKLDINRDMGNKLINESTDFSMDDFASAITYQTKLIARTSIIRNTSVKKTLQVTFSKFNTESGDALELAEKLFKIFNVDLADMFTEFLGFLTAEQADKIGKFKDYFIRNCVDGLLKKVEEQVQDSLKRLTILALIKELFFCKSFSPCDMCCELLMSMADYPELARYVFSLFPHRRKDA
ncbi:uncharacterized protein LOC120633233 isoform X2 [Pararge aegeria]|nr:uncharacterized protein LOC120633233 isoform X2 [Pararge aegeria]